MFFVPRSPCTFFMFVLHIKENERVVLELVLLPLDEERQLLLATRSDEVTDSTIVLTPLTQTNDSLLTNKERKKEEKESR